MSIFLKNKQHFYINTVVITSDTVLRAYWLDETR